MGEHDELSATTLGGKVGCLTGSSQAFRSSAHQCS